MARRALGPLELRFAAAFVGVSIFAVAVFSAAVLVANQENVTDLSAAERQRKTAEVVAVAANSYQTADGWSGDLRPVIAVAVQAGIWVTVSDEQGRLLLSWPSDARSGSGTEKVVDEPIVVDGRDVGRVSVDFPQGGIRPGDNSLRAALFKAVAVSAGLAAFAALIVGVLTARGVVRPLRRLSAAVRSVHLGERSPRIGPSAGPGELAALGRAFDAMAESLEREDQLRRDLVADVAHELRTPVAVMRAETEALRDGVTDPSPEALRSLHEESVRLSRLVEDLQTLASAQAAGLTMDRRQLDLGRVVSDAAHSLAGQFRSATVELELDAPPTPALGDPVRLHQVATNLLSNAVKFSRPGGKVTVRTYTEDRHAVMDVADRGPGVTDAERDAIWGRFYRGDAGKGRDGSGIGLSVVRELVDAHGGTATVANRADGGTRFVVRLPADGPAGPGGETPAPADR